MLRVLALKGPESMVPHWLVALVTPRMWMLPDALRLRLSAKLMPPIPGSERPVPAVMAPVLVSMLPPVLSMVMWRATMAVAASVLGSRLLRAMPPRLD